MPTPRGWSALGAALALTLLWVGFGERELLAAASLLFLGSIAGLLVVSFGRPTLSVYRGLAPDQVHEGERAVVAFTMTSGRPLRNARLEDSVSRLGSAAFTVGRIDPGVEHTARYEILCRPRGIYTVGPAILRTTGPLGLAERRWTVGGVDRLAVYPRVDDLEGLPVVRGFDRSQQAARPTFSLSGGEDFYTLREYREGDDLRHVHWPATARHDELMIRQLELPWQSKALVLLDHRSSSFANSDAFEHAVSGAASILRHLHLGGFVPELWTLDEAARVQHDRYRAAMERLASVQPRSGVRLQQAVTRHRTKGGGGILYLVTGAPDDDLLGAYRLLARDFGHTIVLAVTAPTAVNDLQAGGMTIVSSPPGVSWAVTWAEVMEGTWSTALAG